MRNLKYNFEFKIFKLVTLKDLKRKLYERDEEEEIKKRMLPEDILKLKRRREERGEEFQRKPEKEKEKTQKMRLFSTPERKKKILLTSIIFGVIILAVGLAAFFVLNSFFSSQDFVFSIKAPERVANGEIVEYELTYENKSRRLLKNVELFVVPRGGAYFVEEEKFLASHTFDVGELKPKERGVLKARLQIFSSKGDEKMVRFVSSFEAEGERGRFEKSKSLEHKIAFNPLLLNVKLPEEVVAGEPFDLEVSYSNDGEFAFPDLALVLKPPSQYEFLSSIPSRSSDNTWRVDRLKSRSEGKIILRGRVKGKLRDVKAFEFQLVLFDKESVVVAEGITSALLSRAPLSLGIALNGEPGEMAFDFNSKINVSIPFENTTNHVIRNVKMELILSSRAVDWASVDTGGGEFSFQEKKITWSAGEKPQLILLEPGETGKLEASFNLISKEDIRTLSGKNFKVVLKASISSDDVPEKLTGTVLKGADEATIKINSLVELDAQGFYSKGPFINHGPIPPKVNSETSYTLNWQFVSHTNDLKSTTISAKLPTGVRWLDNVRTSRGVIAFDDTRNMVTWSLSSVDAGVGTGDASEEAFFQIAVTPVPADKGRSLRLLEKSTLITEDAFTDAFIEDFAGALSSSLPDDPAVGFGGGTVIE